MLGHRPGANSLRLLNLLEPGHQAFGRAEPHEILVEQRVHERKQEGGVAARADEVMLAGDLRGLAAARVDHHQLAAAFHHALQAPRRVGHRHQAAVGDHRVGADHEQILRAVDVRHRHAGRELAPEHQTRLHDLRQRVDRGGVEEVARGERAREHGPVEHGAEVVHHRIAGVHADRVVAVLLAHGEQALCHLVVRLLPGDLLPAVGGALHRTA